MSKYNKVFDNVVVTEDMRSRILQNIDEKFGDEPIEKSNAQELEISKEPVKRKVIDFRKYSGVAAAIVAVVLGGFAVSAVYTNFSNGKASYQAEAPSMVEMAEGFKATGTKNAVESARSEAAEETEAAGAVAVMDNAISNEEVEVIVDIDGVDVVLKGDGELFYSAKWESSEGTHYADSDTGLSKEDMIELVRESMKK